MQDIVKMSFSLALDSNTSIYLYVGTAEGYDGEFSAEVNGKPAEIITKPDGRRRIAVSGIPAHKLGDTYEVKISTTNGDSTVQISAMSYVYACLSKTSATELERNSAAALYHYCVHAGRRPALLSVGRLLSGTNDNECLFIADLFLIALF